MDVTYIWLIVGVLLVIAETVGASGIGFIFAGFGALITGALIQLGIIDVENIVVQFTVFFAATALSALVLRNIVRRSRLGKETGYSNMIGETALVGAQGLHKGRHGEVTWSGTTMRAELPKDAGVDSLPAGAQVIIIAINGATLTVTPKE